MSCKQLKFQRLRKNGARNFWCFRWEKNWSSQKARFTHISNFMIFYKISVIPESAVCRDKSEFSNPNPDPKGLGVSGIFQLSPKPTVLKCFKTKNLFQQNLNRYWRIRSKVNASTYVFSTRRWVIIVARTRRKKEKKILASTFGRFRLWTSFESSPVSVKSSNKLILLTKNLAFLWLIKKLKGQY